MPNTGRVKFFERSKLIPMTADVVGSSGGVSVNSLLSFDRGSYWQSDDTSDSIASELSFSFSPLVNISRLIIVDTNIRDVKIEFDMTLSNIVDIDNLRVSSLSPYRNRNPIIYLEFDPIDIVSLRLIAMNTQTPNQRKYIRQVIATNEIGIFQGFPEVSSYNANQNTIVHRASTGVKHIVKQIKTIDTFNLRFKHYPEAEDISLSNKLFDWPERSFILWPCGGGYGSDHFLFESEGWRLQDIYNVQTTGRKSQKWWRNFYKSGAETSLRMVEVI